MGENNFKVAVIGGGYVGLPMALKFAEVDRAVYLVDNNPEKISMLQRGEATIHEPGLEQLLGEVGSKVTFTTDLPTAVQDSLVTFIAVPTPSSSDGSVDTRFVRQVGEEIGTALRGQEGDKIIVNKSTVPPGTAQVVQSIIEENSAPYSGKLAVVSNPEFLQEGKALESFEFADRIVIGTDREWAWHTMKELYEPFLLTPVGKLLKVGTFDAELTKYLANAMLAQRINDANAAAQLCEAVGGDITKVMDAVGRDKRIGGSFLLAGPGWGGSCFPKDSQGMSWIVNEILGYNLPMFSDIYAFNKHHKQFCAQKVIEYYKSNLGGLDGKTLAAWGLTFKANTDDVRESPAIDILKRFTDEGATIVATDPEGSANFTRAAHAEGFSVKTVPNRSKYKMLDGADGLVVLTEWKTFRTPRFGSIAERLAHPAVFDLRNLYRKADASTIEDAGIRYFGIGRNGPASAQYLPPVRDWDMEPYTLGHI